MHFSSNTKSLVKLYIIFIRYSLLFIIPIKIFLSNFPEANIAESNKSGLLVAAIKNKLGSEFSSSAKNYETILSVTEHESDELPLFGNNESNSSKNNTHGTHLLAFLKTYLNFLSLSPIYLSNNSGPFTAINEHLNSFAIHFANKVLPVPGGPKSKIPFYFLISSFVSNLKDDINSYFIFSIPPIFSHVNFGTSVSNLFEELNLFFIIFNNF